MGIEERKRDGKKSEWIKVSIETAPIWKIIGAVEVQRIKNTLWNGRKGSVQVHKGFVKKKDSVSR